MGRYYKPKHQILVDWSNTGNFDHPQSDITRYVKQITYQWGASVLSGSRGFQFVTGQGRITLDEQLWREFKPLITAPAIFQSHLCRIFLDNILFAECVASAPEDRQIVLVSKYTDEYTKAISTSTSTSIPIAQLWHETVNKTAIQQGDGDFDTYNTAPFISEQMELFDFIREFSKLYTGIAYEQRLGQLAFKSLNVVRRASPKHSIIPARQNVFTLDISGKVNSTVSKITGQVIRKDAVHGQVGTQNFANIPAGNSVMGTINAPSGKAVENWSLSVTHSDVIFIETLESPLNQIQFLATNLGTSTETFTVTAMGDIVSSRQVQQVTVSNPFSIYHYGLSEEQFRPWAENTAPYNTRLSLLSSPVTVIKVEIPVTKETQNLLFYDTGTIIEILHDGYDNEGLVARVRASWDKVWTLEWHIIETRSRAIADTDWTFDNDGVILGFNSFLIGQQATGNYLSLAGQLLTLDGEYLEFTGDFLSLAGQLLTLDGEYLEFRDAV